jgi:hypothetical protein
VSIGFPIHGDIALSSDGRRFVLRQGVEEYADRVRAALQIFQGLWWYDQSKGLRFLDVILEKPASVGEALLRSEARRVITAVPGTLSVLRIATSYNRSARSVRLEWTAKSRYGVVEGSTEIA